MLFQGIPSFARSLRFSAKYHSVAISAMRGSLRRLYQARLPSASAPLISRPMALLPNRSQVPSMNCALPVAVVSEFFALALPPDSAAKSFCLA
jgi:hypothetical protein